MADAGVHERPACVEHVLGGVPGARCGHDARGNVRVQVRDLRGGRRSRSSRLRRTLSRARC